MDIADTVMVDVSLDLESDNISFTHNEDIRSPRTPIYAPESFTASPFDHTKFFGPASTKATHRISLPTPPAKPMAWIWQCHLCRQRYPLGVTRRCLLDGHYYCSGEVDRPNLRRKRRGQSCSSEFDYVGWREYGDWRRKALQTIENPKVLRGCENCVFPSQCRTPTSTTTSGSSSTSTQPTAELKVDTSAAIQELDISRYYQSESENGLSDASDQESAMTLGDKKRSKSTDGGQTGDQSQQLAIKESRKSQRKSSRKNPLSPIEEEKIRQELTMKLQEFVMPVLDILNSGAEKLKTQ